MYDFVFTVLAVALGIVVAVVMYDAGRYFLAGVQDRRASKKAFLEAQRLEELRLRNRRIRLEFTEDGWLPPAGWDIDENGDWTPVGMDVTLAGRRHPAKAPEERLEELREEQNSYW